MSACGRFDRLARRVAARRPDAGPLTVFLVEVAAGGPVGTWVLWEGRAREISFDPADGEPPLPPGGLHKLILGPESDE